MVTIICEKDKKKALTKVLDGFFVEKGSCVAIKPNLSVAKREACTDFELLRYLVEYIESFSPQKILIVESDTYLRSIRDVYTVFDYHSLGVELINLSEEPCTTMWPETSFFKAFSYPTLFKEVDCLISFAKLKTHILTKYTGALKNQYGLIPFPDKRLFHRKLDQAIVDANVIFPCTLYVLDSIFAMHGQGPLEGDVIELDLLLSGRDPVAVDHCACRAVGIPPGMVSHLVLAEKSGLGTFEYEVAGEIPEIEGFTLPEPD